MSSYTVRVSAGEGHSVRVSFDESGEDPGLRTMVFRSGRHGGWEPLLSGETFSADLSRALAECIATLQQVLVEHRHKEEGAGSEVQATGS